MLRTALRAHPGCRRPDRAGLGILTAAGCAAFAVWGLAACSAPTRPPNVVMIVIDTLRADRLGSYGYARATSPHLDALAREAVLFENAVAQSSWTGPSIASVFTSLYPSTHGMVDFRSTLDEALPTLAGVFRAKGYRTLGVSANFSFVTPGKGFARDFDAFEVLSRPPKAGEKAEIYGTNSVAGAKVTAQAITLLDGARAQPFFLYVHYMDPHSSYDPPAEFRERFVGPYAGPVDGSTEQLREIVRGELEVGPADVEHLNDLYDAEIAAVDAEVGRLLAHLRALDVFEDSLLVVLADHGEEFLDHGSFFHMFTLYREQVHVPLLVRRPGGAGGGARVASLVELIDVGPTLLELAGLADTRATAGVSQVASMLGAVSPGPAAPALSELHGDPLVTSVWRTKRHRAALTTERWTLLAGDRRADLELYEVSGDPRQERDRVEAEAAERERLDALLGAQSSTAWEERPVGDLSDEQRSRLRALGYSD